MSSASPEPPAVEHAAKASILVVEDDPSILLGLSMNLKREGYAVVTAEDGEAGLVRLREGDIDLVLLDVMLPKLNGYEMLRILREEGNATPVLVLSARSDEGDKIRGLDLGAEDYVTKPFSVPELLARVRAALRRQGVGNHQAVSPPQVAPPSPRRLAFGDVEVDFGTREVWRGGELVSLTVTEFDVLSTLARAEGQALTRQQIFESVWGSGHHGTHRTIDNFVAQLRSKLEQDAQRPEFLLTVRGVGYRLAL